MNISVCRRQHDDGYGEWHWEYYLCEVPDEDEEHREITITKKQLARIRHMYTDQSWVQQLIDSKGVKEGWF